MHLRDAHCLPPPRTMIHMTACQSPATKLPNERTSPFQRHPRCFSAPYSTENDFKCRTKAENPPRGRRCSRAQGRGNHHTLHDKTIHSRLRRTCPPRCTFLTRITIHLRSPHPIHHYAVLLRDHPPPPMRIIQLLHPMVEHFPLVSPLQCRHSQNVNTRFIWMQRRRNSNKLPAHWMSSRFTIRILLTNSMLSKCLSQMSLSQFTK
mmetsp:Transcript_4433/g.16715  ORF Transcript_4433/g.16715 Transcript_4433/m.16715 type:complete len:206 (+) Transcript_4433:513-1130(+)